MHSNWRGRSRTVFTAYIEFCLSQVLEQNEVLQRTQNWPPEHPFLESYLKMSSTRVRSKPRVGRSRRPQKERPSPWSAWQLCGRPRPLGQSTRGRPGDREDCRPEGIQARAVKVRVKTKRRLQRWIPAGEAAISVKQPGCRGEASWSAAYIEQCSGNARKKNQFRVSGIFSKRAQGVRQCLSGEGNGPKRGIFLVWRIDLFINASHLCSDYRANFVHKVWKEKSSWQKVGCGS